MPQDQRQPRLLAVSHEASPTGAPSVLALLLDWLSATQSLSIHTLLLEDGPLRPRFGSVGSVSAVTDMPGAFTLGLLERGLIAREHRGASRIPAAARYRSATARLKPFDIVYLNSITTLDVLPYLRGSPRVVAHIHEGPVTISEWVRSRRPAKSDLQIDRWIAVNADAQAAIQALPGVDPSSVVLHYPFVDVTALRRAPRTPQQLAQLRISLGIPPDAAVVVGAGSIERRKGADLMVQLAGAVSRAWGAEGPQPHFLWVGGDRSTAEWRLLQADIERCGAGNMQVLGYREDPIPYFELADVFALTSREDPFPLVCLENAALGKPVVAYASSGIRELLENAGHPADTGIIPYLDVQSMTQKILDLIRSPELAKQIGTLLARAVATRHDVSVAAPVLAAELQLPHRSCDS